ncbi:hypothetical protein AB1N83_007302 [Pleurotus pulmonarius]
MRLTGALGGPQMTPPPFSSDLPILTSHHLRGAMLLLTLTTSRRNNILEIPRPSIVRLILGGQSGVMGQAAFCIIFTLHSGPGGPAAATKLLLV